MVATLLILGGVDVTAVQLARVRLVDAADAAALDAADALDEGGAYAGGLSGGVVLSDATVEQAGTAYLAARSRPDGISAWGIASGTGVVGGDTAVVVVNGVVEVPMTGWLLSALGQQVSIRVESRARAPLRNGP